MTPRQTHPSQRHRPRLGARLLTAGAALGLAGALGLTAAPHAGATPQAPGAPQSAAAALGITPGTYTNYGFPSGSTGFDDVTWTTTVKDDPGYQSNIFWSHQFDFNKGSGAYFGMQSNGGQQRTFLYSVWDTAESKPGTVGSYCLDFGGEGEGQSCRMKLDWTAGHTYSFTVAHEGGGWFGATVTDKTTGSSFKLGSVKTPATKIAPTGMVDWAEYFEWNDSRATCYDQPGSAASFGLPKANGGSITASVAGTSSSDNGCKPMTRIDRESGGTVQLNAIGNSVRGEVKNSDGTCVDASGGSTEGAEAIAYGCHGGRNQAWVRAADKTLRLSSDYCLNAEGTAAGSAVRLRNCAGDAASGKVTAPARLWTYDPTAKTLKNTAANRCLTAGGSSRPLRLADCSTAANQKWTVPAVH
jgi:hypothetical protein